MTTTELRNLQTAAKAGDLATARRYAETIREMAAARGADDDAWMDAWMHASCDQELFADLGTVAERAAMTATVAERTFRTLYPRN